MSQETTPNEVWLERRNDFYNLSSKKEHNDVEVTNKSQHEGCTRSTLIFPSMTEPEYEKYQKISQPAAYFRFAGPFHDDWNA